MHKGIQNVNFKHKILTFEIDLHTHTNTHLSIYIYIYIYVRFVEILDDLRIENHATESWVSIQFNIFYILYIFQLKYIVIFHCIFVHWIL